MAMPFFADQPLNAMKAVSKVQVAPIWITALQLGPLDLTERMLLSQLPVLLPTASACLMQPPKQCLESGHELFHWDLDYKFAHES